MSGNLSYFDEDEVPQLFERQPIVLHLGSRFCRLGFSGVHLPLKVVSAPLLDENQPPAFPLLRPEAQANISEKAASEAPSRAWELEGLNRKDGRKFERVACETLPSPALLGHRLGEWLQHILGGTFGVNAGGGDSVVVIAEGPFLHPEIKATLIRLLLEHFQVLAVPAFVALARDANLGPRRAIRCFIASRAGVWSGDHQRPRSPSVFVRSANRTRRRRRVSLAKKASPRGGAAASFPAAVPASAVCTLLPRTRSFASCRVQPTCFGSPLICALRVSNGGAAAVLMQLQKEMLETAETPEQRRKVRWARGPRLSPALSDSSETFLYDPLFRVCVRRLGL